MSWSGGSNSGIATCAALAVRKLRTVLRRPTLLVTEPCRSLAHLALRLGPRIPTVRRWRDGLLATWHLPNERSWLERKLFDPVFERWISDTYLREPDPDARERLKTSCMGGLSGVAWAEAYDRRPIDRQARDGDVSFDEAVAVFPTLDRLLPAAAADTVVVQVGASSGREIAYFAERFTGLTFLGTDIDDKIAARAARAHPLANLTFATARAHTLLSDIAVPDSTPLIVFAEGSLQYVQPEHLAVAFEKLAKRGNVRIVLAEPAQEGAASPDRLDGSVWRGNFSYTHDYRYYGERAGLKTIEQRMIRLHFDTASPRHRTVSYFYHGLADRDQRGPSQ
jgi:hypothetical protein